MASPATPPTVAPTINAVLSSPLAGGGGDAQRPLHAYLDSLAVTAQRWADTCPEGHSQGDGHYRMPTSGENIYWTSSENAPGGVGRPFP